MVRLIALVLLASAQAPSLRDRMFAAEDARVAAAADMAPLLEGLRAADPGTVVQAVRALGRFERPALVDRILPLASHARADVRAEALNALGQALAAIPRADRTPLPPQVATVTHVLLARLRTEPDPFVVGVAAETLGRLPFRTVQAVREAERALASLLPAGEEAAPDRVEGEPVGRVVHPASIAGAVKGLETRIRGYRTLEPPASSTLARLRRAAMFGSAPSDADLAFIRRVAWQALNGAGAADVSLLERGLEDPDAQVRRLAAGALGTLTSPDSARLLARALRDASFMVRYEAVRSYGRTLQSKDCAPLLAAVDDGNPHVALAAIDALGSGCPAGPSPVARLSAVTDELSRTEPKSSWHRPAHAFVSLARVARDGAEQRLARFAEHPTWQVRMYAARAAAAMMTTDRLERLAADSHDNVREAALAGLLAARGHEADRLFIHALSSRDYQLVLTAANALKGSPDGERAVPALLQAFSRITVERRDTSRDPRMAILERLQEFGGRRHVPALQSCLADFDPAIARRCAAVLQAWTGSPHTARPSRASAAPVKAPAERRARIAIQKRGMFEVRLFADEAPATVARFVRLARRGYYHGLTFHRVVPNFVLQGGSPGANEYVGDGPYMRDELGIRTHARGTLGISTRGRDTGDAQIFINLADNPRLDHHYTVFAEVTSGMDVVDGILEGDVIERIDVLAPAAAESRP